MNIMLIKIKEYFNRTSKSEKYTHRYVKYPLDYYERKIKLLSLYLKERDCLLDVGCGSGLFMQAIQSTMELSKICGMDFSEEMIRKSLSISFMSKDVHLSQGDVLRLPFKRCSFDFINIDSLLHHLVSLTRTQSKNLAKIALMELRDVLKPNGYLLLNEIYYESYGFSALTSQIIFSLLSLFNKLSIKFPIKEAHKGLIVSFYTRHELTEMITALNGLILEELERGLGMGLREKAVLLHRWGEITYLIQFAKN